ncbi:MAG: hypothetical protein ABSG64_07995 [Solirubrobacteraceae bacterium]|jgi:adenosylmethionine-8-amino-7-oxononanoate aminotransferase
MSGQHTDGEATPRRISESAEELLSRALLDQAGSAAVAVRVRGLALCEELTIIFHGRRDLSTIHTYVALGGHGAGDALKANDLLRVPCYLDLADAASRRDAEERYREQAGVLRETLRAADTVLAVWCEPLAQLAASSVRVEDATATDADLPAQLLMPVALRATECGVMVAAVCSARTLAAGAPPLGIACVQQEVSHVYPLTDDPERCLEDFFARTTEHAHQLAERLAHQEASVERFLELSGD